MERNNTKYNSRGEWNMDNRTRDDLEERIDALARAYVPEWHFDRENPDIGAVIGQLFAYQMAGNIDRYNKVLDKYHTEFVNMLGVSLLPARPASSIVIMGLVQDTIPGVEVYKGTKLTTEAEGDNAPVIFETAHNLYVTNSSLNYIFMTEEGGGRIIPLKGRFQSLEIVERTQDAEEEAAGAPAEETGGLTAFRLFGSRQEGIQKNALLFYHSAALDVENDNIYVKLTQNRKLLDKIRDGAYEFQYYTKEGLLPVESVEIPEDGDTLILRKEKENAKTELDGREYSLLALVAKEPVRETCTLQRLAVSSSGRFKPAEHVNNGTTDFDVASFDPFGDTLSLFQDCYVGHDGYFSKAGAVITIMFDVSYRENRVLATIQEVEESLKVIKRKPRVIVTDAMAETRAEEISFEYFNGVGWKKLACRQEVRGMFAGGSAGRYEISFICPDDWEETGAGAYQGRCIRMQLLKADNCYMRPCIHYYPHIENLSISFSYEERYMDAERLISLAGTKRLDLTKHIRENRPFPAFSQSLYTGDALYLGFSRKMEKGPVSLLFQLEEDRCAEGIRYRLEYSSAKGFQQMKMLDYTADMSRSGVIMFMPPSDMAPMTLEDKRAYWIRLSPLRQEEVTEHKTLPVVTDIRLNAVQVTNVDTRPEENFYLEESVPNMTVNLGVSDILDIDLWVNEMGRISEPQMQRMIAETPELVRAEYDILGDISSFYVKWEETDQLDDAPSPRCYILDRMNSRLIFGDGVRVRIPAVLDDVAFKAVIRRCSGQAGNVEAGSINGLFGNVMFIDRIYNPVKAYGGSNIETMANALRRGGNILKSRRRLVSVDDYIEEILSFSDNIDKVKCVMGRTAQGEKKENAITFILLLKDFEVGAYLFHNLAAALKKHLLEECELTVGPKELFIVEPVFVKLSVDIWAHALRMDDGFELQELLQETLEQYLNPVSDGAGKGWDIGVLPKKSQLLMRMNILKSRAVISKMVVTAQYTDKAGSHEVDLEDMKESPFFVCRSGSHRINIMTQEQE